jgi:hypothetical protein
MAAVLLTKNDPARSVGQLLNVLHKAKGRYYEALRGAESPPYNRNPAVADAVKHLIELETKGAIGGATTAQSGWASELAPYEISRQAFMSWEGQSIVGRVLKAGARRVDWRVPTPKETAGGMTAGWRGESLGAIVAKSVTDTFRIDYREAVVITAASDELFRLGAVAEMALSRMVTEAVVTFTDTSFLDPAMTATSARPASITNGALSVTSTGSTAAQITADLASMVQLMQVASDGDAWVWTMRPVTYYTIAAKLAGAGTPTTPGFLLGIPVILGVKSPRQITLIDASNLAFASDESVVVDLSNEATLQMDGAPTQSGAAGTGSAAVSLFQTNLTGIRAVLATAWQSIRGATGSPTMTGGAVYMVTAF